jgi:hypothetical protein
VATVSRAAAFAAAVGVLVVAAAAGLLLFSLRDPGDATVVASAAQPTAAPAEAPTSRPDSAAPAADEASPAPAAVPPPLAAIEPAKQGETEFVPSVVFEDQWVEDAMREALANPSDALPGRDAIATELLNQQILAAGHDLTGMNLTIYPDGPIPSFLLLETTDDTALIASDVAEDTNGEQLLSDIINADAVMQFQVETLVLRHTGVDEIGPYVLTLTVGIAEMQSGLATGESVFEELVAQIERP